MQIFQDIKEIQNELLNKKKQGYKIGFVPTMGYLHEGHTSLIKKIKPLCDITVVSVFVNPIQFGPNEDYNRYPKNLERDIAILENLKVDYLFTPTNDIMYPKGFSTKIITGDITTKLCGKYRPGHFDGVTTVVAKLFNIVQPDIAAFGKKDAQQLLIIKKMIEELNFPIEIIEGETIREEDGLAMSSRNTYLTFEERKIAPEIYRGLKLAMDAIKKGEKDPDKIIEIIDNHYKKFSLLKPQYIEAVDITNNLEKATTINKNTLIAVAVYIGNTRLIDNFFVKDII